MMVLWPIMGFMGAQGYTGSVTVGAILALPFLRPARANALVWVIAAFLAWVVLLTLMSPSIEPIMEGNLLSGDFSVNVPGIRFALLILAAMMVIYASLRVAPGAAPKSLYTSRVAALVQAAVVVCVGFFMAAIIAAIVGMGQSDPASMMQNLLRNANAYTLLLPFLLVWLFHLDKGKLGPGLAFGLLAVSALAFLLTGTQTAVLALIVMLAFMTIARQWPQNGLRVLCRSLAAYVLLAPFIIPVAATLYLRAGWALPPSFYSRAKGWQLIGEKIAESPLTGHGVEASYSWGQLFSDRPVWLAEAESRFGPNMGWANYEILNSHPHNMPLQVWVETGAIGAALVAVALLLLGQQVQTITNRPMAMASAGLLGISAVICSVNYSMWNEAYWASVTIVVSLLILYQRQELQKV